MIRRLISRILCKLGAHGPEWFGTASTPRSEYAGRCMRRCCRCGALWAGGIVVRHNVRTLGGWERVA